MASQSLSEGWLSKYLTTRAGLDIEENGSSYKIKEVIANE